jgi:CheY-like chemotaxis protein
MKCLQCLLRLYLHRLRGTLWLMTTSDACMCLWSKYVLWLTLSRVFSEMLIPDPQDNMINQRLLAKLLANLGCTTRTCSNGQECVDLLVSLAQAESSEDTRFDLVLMDLEMCVLSCAFDFYPLMSRRPVLDGLGATQRIRELEAQGMLKYVVPVVAVSGNARSEWTVRINSSVATLCSCSSHQDHAREAGMNDFVRKPYSKAELDTLLTQWRPAAASMKSRLSVT